MPRSSEVEGWVSVFDTSTDYEADMVRDRLDSSGISAVVLTQRDHAFNLTVGILATVHVMVPPEQAEKAKRLIQEEIFTDEELDQAAAMAPPGETEEGEQLLDSGNEELNLSPPEEEEDEEEDGERRV